MGYVPTSMPGMHSAARSITPPMPQRPEPLTLRCDYCRSKLATAKCPNCGASK